MPELREVFEMTTKQMEPDVDAWRDQEKRQRRSSRTKKISVFAVAAAFAVVALALVFMSRSDPRDQVAPANTPAPSYPQWGPYLLDLPTGDTTPLPVDIRAGALYFGSPDGTMLVYSDCCSSPNPVWVANVDGTEIRQITPDGVDGFGAQWSPDGSMLVYQQRDGLTREIGNLVIVDVATGRTTQITDLEPAKYGLWFMSPSFSSDGEHVLFHLPRGPNDDTQWDLWSVPVGGGEPALEVRDASMGAWAPTGGALAYVDSPSGDWTSPRLMVRDPDGVTRLLVEGERIDFARWSPDGTRIAYSDDERVSVVNVATGDAAQVAESGRSGWLDDETLVVVP